MRFVGIYGLRRTLFKSAGRLRIPILSIRRNGSVRDIGIVGCGQYAFATISYFLWSSSNHRVLACFDIDESASASFARAFHAQSIASTVDDLLRTPGLRTIYVASNHASHAAYAISALSCGLDVYLEKPIAVSLEDLRRLSWARRNSSGRLFAGYNRPFSSAIGDLRREMQIDHASGMSMQCFVAGHKLHPDHWYRHPEEGTRVCGNLGHWLDLFVHILNWRGLPDRLQIALAWANPEERDDNLSVAISSDRNDVFAVMLSSRCEPFEGINESIHLQHSETTCRIDDFRRMTIWQGERRVVRRYWPKDVGHKRAIMQPFSSGPNREWREIEISSLLMLRIADMVRKGMRVSEYSLDAAWRSLTRANEYEASGC